MIGADGKRRIGKWFSGKKIFGEGRGLALLLCAVLVFSGCSLEDDDPYGSYVDAPVKSLSGLLFKGEALDREELGEPVGDKSALTLYYTFLRSLKSGEVKKTRYSTKSLYEVAAYTSEEVVFTTRADGNLVMTYRQRQPLVFWYYPETDYYDGECYYYKHNGDWFVDTFNRHAKQVEPDALGIPSDVISLYRITESQVFRRPDGGYQAYVQAESRADQGRTAQVIGVMDEEGIFSYIEATVVYPDPNGSASNGGTSSSLGENEGEKPVITEKYIIEYSRINEVVEVEPPATLTQEEMEYLQQEYRSAQKQRGEN